MKNLLLVGFQFPPYSVGSGVHRVTRFASYLKNSDWNVHVLTADLRAYERIDEKTTKNVPPHVEVTRAFALDTQRHLAIRGRYPLWFSLPDRWSSWVLGAVPAGLGVIFSKRIDVIMATFPIATAVLIGLILHRLTGKPLVIDFRDSMTEEHYPRNAQMRRVSRWIEKSVIRSGSRFIFTAPSARQMYLDRYPDLTPEACVVIGNGYEEEDFVGIQSEAKTNGTQLRFVHSGVVYPDDRDPGSFFKAVGRLKREGKIAAETVRFDLRAAGSEQYYAGLLREHDIEDLVHLLPAISHRAALQDTANADGLLVFQAASCNHQIPAKVYEYLRLQKPIFAMTAFSGDTAAVLQDAGGATIADLSDENSIYQNLLRFSESVRRRQHPLPNMEKVRRYTRKSQTGDLAQLLDQLTGSAAHEAVSSAN